MGDFVTCLLAWSESPLTTQECHIQELGTIYPTDFVKQQNNGKKKLKQGQESEEKRTTLLHVYWKRCMKTYFKSSILAVLLVILLGVYANSQRLYSMANLSAHLWDDEWLAI